MGKYILVIAGIIILAIGGFRAREAIISLQWPDISAVIISAELESIRVSPGHSTRHKAIVLYEYIVDGKSYTGDKVSFTDSPRKDPNHGQLIVKKYPKGKSVKAFYNPKDHAEAVLERSGEWYLLPEFYLGTILIIVGLLKKVRKSDPILRQ
jgi:hypothetical protein